MNKSIGAKALFPIFEMAKSVSSRTVMFKGAVIDEAFNKFFIGMLFIVAVKLEPTCFDLPFSIVSPVICFLLAIPMTTDCGIAFNANNGAPDGCAVFIFTFIY